MSTWRERVTYTRSLEQDDTPVRGNAMASGDGAFDRECEDQILADLDQGNVYAWARACVTAQLGSLMGRAYLGGCSYHSEGELWAEVESDLRQEALDDLAAQVEAIRALIALIA